MFFIEYITMIEEFLLWYHILVINCLRILLCVGDVLQQAYQLVQCLICGFGSSIDRFSEINMMSYISCRRFPPGWMIIPGLRTQVKMSDTLILDAGCISLQIACIPSQSFQEKKIKFQRLAQDRQQKGFLPYFFSFTCY